MSRTLLLLSLLALASSAAAADLAACADGARSAVGRKARVTLESGESRVGELVRVTADAVALRARGEEQVIEAARVERIEVRGGSKTVRNILLGAGAGAAVGVLFGAAYDEADSDSLAILFGAIGAGGGAGLGAALPARRVVCD